MNSSRAPTGRPPGGAFPIDPSGRPRDDSEMTADNPELPPSSAGGKVARVALQIAGGAVPVAGGLLSAAASSWSEHEQGKVNQFFEQWLRMVKDELREKEQTVVEIMARLDLQDEKVTQRLESPEYQSLLKKSFREWGCAESEEKRQYVRNILANAAATELASDDVVRLFLEWINVYSELHFKVVSTVYNAQGITRAGMWTRLGKKRVPEDSADADLFKLLVRDLSTGGVIRQHRQTDYYGNFIKKTPAKRGSTGSTLVSAFDDQEQYELTKIGQQFVHYAMTDLPPKIEFNVDQTNVL
jgi:hypothetical protein